MAVTAGCAVIPFAYRHADSLILWQVDRYFDLTAEQRADLSARLKPVLARHRREALPQYGRVLVDANTRVERGLTGDDIDWFYGVMERLRSDLLERVVADGGWFLASVSPSQVKHLESVFLRDNEKAARLAEGLAEDRGRRLGQQTVDFVEDWAGDLSREQRAQILVWSRLLPDNQPVWVRYRRQRQQEWLALLRRPLTPVAATDELRMALIHQDQTAPGWYRDTIREWRAGIKAMALQIDRILTPRQRDHVSHRVASPSDTHRAGPYPSGGHSLLIDDHCGLAAFRAGSLFGHRGFARGLGGLDRRIFGSGDLVVTVTAIGGGLSHSSSLAPVRDGFSLACDGF